MNVAHAKSGVRDSSSALTARNAMLAINRIVGNISGGRRGARRSRGGRGQVPDDKSADAGPGREAPFQVQGAFAGGETDRGVPVCFGRGAHARVRVESPLAERGFGRLGELRMRGAQGAD